jgi:hypothetical protein
MLYFLKTLFISFIIIFLLHYIYNFLKENLVPKQKNDLAKYQSKKYKEIVEELKNMNKVLLENKKEEQTIEEIPLENIVDYSVMEEELIDFATNQLYQ